MWSTKSRVVLGVRERGAGGRVVVGSVPACERVGEKWLAEESNGESKFRESGGVARVRRKPSFSFLFHYLIKTKITFINMIF